MAEIERERAFNPIAIRLGWMPRKFIVAGYRGWPDRWYLRRPGLIRIIEWKRVGKSPNEQQCLRIAELNEMGFPTIWTDNHAEAIEFLSF